MEGEHLEDQSMAGEYYKENLRIIIGENVY
jgi:hypothetical protein